MFDVIKDVLLEINQKLSAANEELNAKMTAVNAASTDHAQYCGPYKLEKTLGKGQTGMCAHSWTDCVRDFFFERVVLSTHDSEITAVQS